MSDQKECKKILVCHAGQRVVDDFRVALENEECEVHYAPDGEIALTLIDAIKPNLIFAQLMLLILRGTALGRYWMPALPAFGVALSAGFLGPFSDRWRDRATLVVLVLFVLYEGWFLWGALIVNHYLIWGA